MALAYRNNAEGDEQHEVEDATSGNPHGHRESLLCEPSPRQLDAFAPGPHRPASGAPAPRPVRNLRNPRPAWAHPLVGEAGQVIPDLRGHALAKAPWGSTLSR